MEELVGMGALPSEQLDQARVNYERARVQLQQAEQVSGDYRVVSPWSGVDVDVAYQDVMTAMGRVARNLPPDMDPPVIINADPSQLRVMELTISSEIRDLVWLREWADDWLTARLLAGE